MRKLLLVVCLLAATCDSPMVPERTLNDIYDFRVRTPALRVLRWPAGSTVRVFVVADGEATLVQYLRDATTHAMQVWNTAALYGEIELESAGAVEGADVVVEYSTAASPLDLNGCIPSGGVAFTTFCLTQDGEHLLPFPLRVGGTTPVKFVVTVRTSEATSAEVVRRLVAHELGHTLGISQHSPKQTDLMYGGALNRDDTSPADRATLQVLYHSVPDITP